MEVLKLMATLSFQTVTVLKIMEISSESVLTATQ